MLGQRFIFKESTNKMCACGKRPRVSTSSLLINHVIINVIFVCCMSSLNITCLFLSVFHFISDLLSEQLLTSFKARAKRQYRQLAMLELEA